MTRRTSELVAGQRLRLVTAHPDDSLWYTQLILETLGRDGYVDEALLTPGSKGRDVRKNVKPAFRVDKGYRTQEEMAAAAIMGLHHVFVYAGRDGRVKEDVERLAKQVAKDTVRDGIGILVANRLTDHSDHIFAADVAEDAARLAAQENHPVGVLLVHHLAEGEYISKATPESMALAFTAASKHQSQWRMKPGIHENWPLVPGGFSMHPDDLASLDPYPLLRDASFTWIPPEQVATNAGELTAMRYTNVQI